MSHPRHIHLTGRLSLASAEEVFTKVAEIAGPCVRRIPDGETGGRARWIGWQGEKFKDNPSLVLVERQRGQLGHRAPEYASQPRYAAKPGVALADVRFDDLGYGDAALASYAIFARLKAAGTIGRDVRFQVCLPTTLAILTCFFSPADQAALEPTLDAAIRRELARIVAAIPHDQLAIQWDVAEEFDILEAGMPTYLAEPKRDIVARLVALGAAVPPAVELGYHLCYGIMGQRHFVEPQNTALLVDITNATLGGLKRAAQWVHVPVPIGRDDDAYFAPLETLKLGVDTELFLGLVHSEDGLDGAKRRIAAAARHTRSFGVASECGLSRQIPGWAEQMLVLHRQAADI